MNTGNGKIKFDKMLSQLWIDKNSLRRNVQEADLQYELDAISVCLVEKHLDIKSSKSIYCSDKTELEIDLRELQLSTEITIANVNE